VTILTWDQETADRLKARHLRYADKIIILSAAEDTLQQGTYEELERGGSILPGLNDNEMMQISENPTETTDDEKEILEQELADEFEISEEAKDLSRQPGDIAVYRYYLNAIGAWKLLVFLFFVILNVGSSSFSTIWLKWWADAGGSHIWLYIGIYFLLGFAYSVGNGGYAWYNSTLYFVHEHSNPIRAICVVIGPSSGRYLHGVLLDIVMRLVLRIVELN
jgi:ATP-binding cassette subfamily C (CFTR/MRP) protein 1